MAFNFLSPGQLRALRSDEALDRLAPQILLKGLGRPWRLYAAHAAVFGANFGGFVAFVHRDIFRLLRGDIGEPRDASSAGPPDADAVEKRKRAKRSLASLLFVKFLVWQHLAEAIGCRQGPLGGHFGMPNNWKFRLSVGTIKHPLVPFLGKRRTIVDLMVHVLFFVSGAAFLRAKEYKLNYIRALCACDVWIACSDLTQFFASTGHAYFSMLLSACFPENEGRLAGMQTALIMQWFFSGIGKLGPWFTYVNGPFMLQSRLLEGQRWLFDLLIQSPTDLSPTFFGKVVAHVAAAVEYVAPVALMLPSRMRPPLTGATKRGTDPAREVSTLTESSVPPSEEAEALVPRKRDRFARAANWFGLVGITGMHAYILTMPAPFDVYSWNASFGLSAIYLFFQESFAFDHTGAKRMNRGLMAFLMGEFALCWYGQFFPDKIGYYLSHRYWAGNWVQTFFFVKKSPAVFQKLDRVKSFSQSPKIWKSLEPLSAQLGPSNMAYLWLANMNMKAAPGLILKAVRIVGGPGAELSDYSQVALNQVCCGEFRDALYTVPVLPTIQEQIGFEAGECFMVRLGAFGLGRDSATWGIYDLKEGLLKSGLLHLSQLAQMHSLPSQSVAKFA